MSWDWSYKPYTNAATRRAQAARAVQRLSKKGAPLAPVKITGRSIARTFWGKAWCAHLESLGDYANRLPRGRTYVRNGSVLDLQITAGRVTARVMGSQLYEATLKIAPLPAERWEAIQAECAGQIDSLVELLQGRLSDAVMTLITHPQKGLFPLSADIRKSCTCPDSAGICKHLAAVLYGVGALLDDRPQLLFRLRGVDHRDLIGAATTTHLSPVHEAPPLTMDQLADVFGIELATEIQPLDEALKPTPAKTRVAQKKSLKKPAPKTKVVARKRVVKKLAR